MIPCAASELFISSAAGGIADNTTTLKLALSESGGTPLSVTVTVIRLVLGAWAAVGVQLNKPPAVMLAPAGAPGPSVNVSVWGGRSVSVALAVKLSSEPAATLQSARAARTGGVLGTGAAKGVMTRSRPKASQPAARSGGTGGGKTLGFTVWFTNAITPPSAPAATAAAQFVASPLQAASAKTTSLPGGSTMGRSTPPKVNVPARPALIVCPLQVCASVKPAAARSAWAATLVAESIDPGTFVPLSTQSSSP